MKASGVGLHSDCLPAYQKLKGPTRKHKYIIYTLNSNNTEIIVDKTSAETDYDGFLKDLPEDQCRWAVYDLEFEKDGAKRNKICFISWCVHLVYVEVFIDDVWCCYNTSGPLIMLKSSRRWYSQPR